jgi:hypothetical protein
MDTKHYMIATFTEQSPLDGRPEQVFRVVDENTTVVELIQWQRKKSLNAASWTKSKFNIQILSESK